MKTATLAAAVAITMTALGAHAKELRLSAAPPPASPWGKITQKFVDKVTEASGGALTITPYMGGKLGGEQDVVKQIARGRIDMGVMSNTAISLLVPTFGLLASPYAFESAEQFDCVMDNHLLKTFGDEFAAAKVHPLSWMEVGYQVVFSQSAGAVPEDFAGIKLRTAPSATDTLFIKQTGATPVPMAPNEAVPAMKTGQVEGASQLSVFGIATGYDKVAPHIVMTRHQHQVGAIIMSDRAWAGLSTQEKAWIEEAAPIFLELRGAIRGAEGALLGKAASEGATVVDLDDTQLAAWKALAPAAQKAILADLGNGADAKWREIEQAKSACSDS